MLVLSSGKGPAELTIQYTTVVRTIQSYVYVMEFLGPLGRTWLGCQHLQFFAVGYISLSLIAYYARDWHYMQLIIS